MSYRRMNGFLLVAIAFMLCTITAFLLYRQDFFGVSQNGFVEKQVVPTDLIFTSSTTFVPAIFTPTSTKILKNFGSCGDESKNESILSYSPDLVNALLDNINDSHCEAPKPGYPNYSFILQDPSLIRIAEMTPDYKYIFYLKVENTDTSSTYFLYKTDIATRQTNLIDSSTISNDWPLQKDFYEDRLLPRQSATGTTSTYQWFASDPKGRSNSQLYLKEKSFSL